MNRGYIDWPPRYPFIDTIRIFPDNIIISVPPSIHGKIPLPPEVMIFSTCDTCIIESTGGEKKATEIYRHGSKILVTIPGSTVKLILPTREWVKKFLEILPRWIDTLEIALNTEIESRPSYVNDAINIFKKLGLSKTLFFEVVSRLVGRKISRGAGKTKSPRLYLNWVASLIAQDKTPTFEWIGIKGRGISNPKLPIIIKSEKIAELLAIWSTSLSFYEVKDQKGVSKNLIASSSDESLLMHIHDIISQLLGEITPSVEKRKGVTYYRYRNVFLAELLVRAGAKMGRKSKILSTWRIPDWILEDKKYIHSWFKGIFSVTGHLKLQPRKNHYEIYYVRGIEITRLVENQKIMALINQFGRKAPIANIIQLPQRVLIDLIELKRPPIITQEKEMLDTLLNEKSATKTRIDRFLFIPADKRLVAEWVISIYGKERLRKLIRSSILPQKLVDDIKPYVRSITT